MGFSAAHMAELGLTRWRLRGAEPSSDVESQPAQLNESSPSLGDASSAPLPPSAQHAQTPVAPAPAAKAESSATETSSQFDVARLTAELSNLGWDELEQHLRRQTVRDGATQAVFGVGVRDARVMVIGEAPGAEEDRAGQPFVGRAGQLLDLMLHSIGLSRAENVYIANICKFHPPANRDPHVDEIQQDLPYLLRQIELVQPQLLLAVGRIAAQTLLQAQVPVGRLRSQEHVFGEQKLPLVVTYHPAYLLRQAREKAKVWADLKRARAIVLSHDA